MKFLAYLNVNMPANRVAADTVIFDVGEVGDKMYIVREGVVHIQQDDTVLEKCAVGACFGEMSLIDNSPRHARAVAQTACQLVVIDKARFLSLIRESPMFALEIMHIIAERIRKMNRKLD